MTSTLALRPDLDECLLEDRTLMYAGPGLYPSQFIPSAGLSPSFVVGGFQQSNTGPGSSGSTPPGPQFFYLQIGAYTTANGGIRTGGTISIFQPPQTQPTLQGPGVGSGSNTGGAGGISNASGYGGSISSGYNTALSASNNFGMGTTALGSVTAHVSGTTDQVVEAQNANASTNESTTGTGTSSSTDTNATPPAPMSPMSSPGQGSLLSPMDRLMGKGLGSPNNLLKGPGTSTQP